VRAFWNLVKRDDEPTYHKHVLEQELRPELIEALRAENVLVRADPAKDWYPCPSECAGRSVYPASLGNSALLVAVCGHEERQCMDEYIHVSDLEMVAISIPGLIAMLRRLFALEAGELQGPSFFPGVHLLGTSWIQGQLTEVWLARHPHEPAFPLFLMHRRGARVPSLVFAPTATRLPAELVQQYSMAGDKVELQFLDQLVGMRDRRIVLADASLTKATGDLPPPYCRVFGRGGHGFTDHAGYKDYIAGKIAPNLVLDLRTTVGRGFCAYLRNEKGKWVRIRLAANWARVLAALMEAGRPLDASELAKAAGSVNHPVRLFMKAREEVDVKLGDRYGYRAFHTVPRADGVTKYEFRPPPDFHFAVLRPLA